MNEPRDELETLLQPPVETLMPPPGSFEHIRHTARRRRNLRAVTASGAVVLVVAATVSGSLYLSDRPHQTAVVVQPTVTATPTVTVSSRPTPSGAATPPVTASPAPSRGERTSSPGASRAPTPSAAASAPGGVVAPPPSVGAASTPLCATSQLSASLSGANAGAGNFHDNLVLTNHSTSSCHVRGYPGLSVLDAAGNQIGPAATYVSGATADTVVLAPGDSASDTIHTGTGAGTGFCEPVSSSVRVYPPGNLAALLVPAQLSVCDHVFTLTPFAAGTSGNGEGGAGIPGATGGLGPGPTSTSSPTPTPTNS